MSTIGTPFTETAKRALLCGSGELGKEVVIELQRLGVEVIALDSYANAPAMQVADRSHVLNMLDPVALRSVIVAENSAAVPLPRSAVTAREKHSCSRVPWVLRRSRVCS